MAPCKLPPWPRAANAHVSWWHFYHLYFCIPSPISTRAFIAPVISVDPLASECWQPCPDSWTLLLPSNPCYSLFGSNNVSSLLRIIIQTELVWLPQAGHMQEQTVNEPEWSSVHPGAVGHEHECIMVLLFLLKDWDLHMASVIQRSPSMSLSGRFTHTFISSLSPTLSIWTTHSTIIQPGAQSVIHGLSRSFTPSFTTSFNPSPCLHTITSLTESLSGAVWKKEAG